MALHPSDEPHRLPSCRPGPMLTTLLMVCVIAAVVILPSVGLLYALDQSLLHALDQKSLAGEDLT